MNENIMDRQNVFSNFLWRFFERCGAQVVNFVVSILLARLLLPSDYGTVALMGVFISILDIFVDSGFGTALIQKEDADSLDFSSVFYFNMVVCIILYGVIFVCSPLIAKFYRLPEVTAYMRVLALSIIISGLKNVQQAHVSKTMQFKRFFFATLIGTVGAAVVGITMAYAGFGVWALIAQHLFNTFVDTCVLWFTVKWRPHIQFSFSRLKVLFSFGWKLLFSSLLETVYNKLRSLVIGRMYTTDALAYYNQGEKIPSLFVNNINASISSVLFPAMSAAQKDSARVKRMTRKSIVVSSYILWPMMVGLAVTAEPLVKIFLTEKWIPCVPFLRIFCINSALMPIHTANLNAMKAMGRSDLYLKLEIIKKIVGIAVLAGTIWLGPLAMAYSMLALSVVCQIINAWPNWKLLHYGYGEQMKDIFPSVLLAVVMGGSVYCIGIFELPRILTLVIQIVVGVLIYLLGSWVIKLEGFYYVRELLLNIRVKVGMKKYEKGEM